MKATIGRTATFTWSLSALESDSPLIATGTVAGALDESFSNESVLEVWQPDYSSSSTQHSDAKPLGSVATSARFNRLAWGYVNPSRPKGLLAAGLENGELAIWDADKVLGGASSDESQVMKNTTHTGPVRGLDFNGLQPNLLSSGAVNGEIFIWDLNSPGKPYSPGARSQKLDEITSLAWNAQVPHVLATSSSSGYTVVWDLKGKREVVALQYGGGAGTAGGNLGGINGGMGGALAAGGRRGMSAVAWHPDTPTRLVTASEDDSSPVIMLWDLRNSRAPEKIMTGGHDKGVLSLSWCKQDADLLLSCGKDNRAICWNPQTCEIVGELPSSSNWSFEVQWCPRNPGMLATASFDGRIAVHSLQTTNTPEGEPTAAAPVAEGSDFFSQPAQQDAPSKGLSLKQPPKWLRRPVSATFGFGGQLVSTSNLPGPSGKAQSSTVHLRDVVTEPSIVQRATKLQQALDAQALAEFCDERSKDATTRPDDIANWKALQTLFRADSRDELVALLGFSKEDVAAKVSSAIAAFKSSEPSSADAAVPAAPVALAEEPAAAATSAGDEDASALNDDGTAETAAKEQEAGSSAQDASLFGDDDAGANDGALADASGADFFSQIGANEASSAAHGSAEDGAPSANGNVGASAAKPAFRIYPAEESAADKLITRALVLGDFRSAVSLCISSDRFADALLLAVRGGEDLLARTQKAYFDKRTAELPYLRLFQSIVSDDLTDVVQNAELAEWQEIFVVLCTFAKQDEFANLAEQLGQRLESQYVSTQASDLVASREHRKNAVLCYLAAGKLEKVAGMWIDEMKEEELALRNGARDESAEQGTLYSAHAEALQTFMEKITVFQNAVGYVDADLQQAAAQNGHGLDAESATRAYKLGPLYDRIHEYIELLADQGLIASALKFVDQTPGDYRPRSSALPGLAGPSTAGGLTAGAIKQRLQQAEAARPKAVDSGVGSQAAGSSYSAAAPSAASNGYSYDQYSASSTMGATAVPTVPSIPSVPLVPAMPAYASQDPYAAVAPVSQPVAAQPQTQSRYAPSVPAPAPTAGAAQPDAQAYTYNPYSAPNQAYGAADPMRAPAPPMGMSFQSKQQTLPPPPPIKRDNSGWNDVPLAASGPIRTPSAMGQKAKAITSPFPNSPAGTPAPYGAASPQGPPRGSTPSRGMMSPPPQGGGQQYGARPGGVQSPPGFRPPGTAGMAPPPRSGQAGPSQPGQFAPPPQHHQQQQQQQQMPPQGGPYGRPPSAMGSASYGPPGGGAPPGAARPPPAPGMNVPGQQQPGMPGMAPPSGGAPMRAVTPGAGAGAPPRSGTPGAKAAPALKYPAGDRSHIPDNQKSILQTFGQELARLKAVTPPTQKRMMDDTERRINLLLDHLNCGTIDPKMVQGLLQLVGAINARNQQAALAIHLQLATSATGDLTAALVGVKMLISRMGA